METLINTPAIFAKMPISDTLDIKKFGSYRHHQEHMLVYSQNVLRYAKNYSNGTMEYSLILATQCDDIKKVEAYLDGLATKITKKQITSALQTKNKMEYLDKAFEETK